MASSIPILVVILLVDVVSAYGQDESVLQRLSTDRPGQTTPPSVLQSGSVQIEAGVQLARDKAGDGSAATATRTLSAPDALIRISLLSSMELRVGAEFRSAKMTIGDSDRTASGVTSLSVGTKLGITVEKGAIPEAAFVARFALPAGSGDFHPAGVVPTFLLTTRTSLAKSANLYCTIGGSWGSANGTGTGIYTTHPGATLFGNLSGFVELYGSFPPGLSPMHSADAGLALAIAPNLQRDPFGGAGITSTVADCFANVGISLRLPR